MANEKNLVPLTTKKAQTQIMMWSHFKPFLALFFFFFSNIYIVNIVHR